MTELTPWAGRLQGGRAADCADEPQDFVFAVPSSPRGAQGEETIVVPAFVGAASDNFSDTGTVLWPAAPLLCYFLLSDAGRQLVQGASVLELGAGVGIPGLVAGRCAWPGVLMRRSRRMLLSEPTRSCAPDLMLTTLAPQGLLDPRAERPQRRSGATPGR